VIVEEGEAALSTSWEGRFLDAKSEAAELDELTGLVAFVLAAHDDREDKAAIASATCVCVCMISCACKYSLS